MLKGQRRQMDKSDDPRYNFGANPTVDEWPDDEPIEEFLAALHEWCGRSCYLSQPGVPPMCERACHHDELA
jgi:hypothetical protein